MSDAKNRDDIIESLREFALDVNPDEIADHIKFNSLENWCNAWREAFLRELNGLKEAIK